MTAPTFVRPTTQRVNLNDFAGQPIGLRYLSDETGIKVNTPDGEKIRDAVRAAIVVFDPISETAFSAGETLVFQQVIGRTVRDAEGSWVVGRMTKHTGGSYEGYYLLDELEDDEYGLVITAFTAALGG